MAIGEYQRTCFVVMPFGEKQDADGQEIDFDDVYRFFFKKAIEGLGLRCVRCDEIAESGSIHEKMFKHLCRADVAVVDITTNNANVFYELGVRHTLAKAVTVLIRRKGTTIPFNIQGLQVIEYDQKKFASIERAKERIVDIIKFGLLTKTNDSPVHAVLNLNIGAAPKPLAETRVYRYSFVNSQKAIGLVTGELANVRNVDVWVNPENTNMQMARPMENSISAVIRCLGAQKRNGKIIDSIAIDLASKMDELNATSVEPGEVVVTESGELARSHKVRKLLHVAAMIGQVGKGYFPIPDVSQCVTNALDAVETLNTKEPESTLRSILFPLMGSGSEPGGRNLEERIETLLDKGIAYFRENLHSTIDTIFFLTYSDRELEVCQRFLDANPCVVATGRTAPATTALVSSEKPSFSGSATTPPSTPTTAAGQGDEPAASGTPLSAGNPVDEERPAPPASK